MPTSAPAWAPPLLALQLLTRLPVPPLARLDDEEARDGLARSTGWLPLVGTLVGIVTAGAYVAASRLWPPPVAAALALVVEALLTGAFHEDAAADFCDAFGGVAEGDEARRIMRDSRIGSYGALGLLLLVGLRWTATAALPSSLAVSAIVASATIGRALPAFLLALAPPPAGEIGIGALVGAPPASALLLATLLVVPGSLPLSVADPVAIAAALLAEAALLSWLARAIRRRLGGSTGDCLGFAAYAGQVVVLLAAVAG